MYLQNLGLFGNVGLNELNVGNLPTQTKITEIIEIRKYYNILIYLSWRSDQKRNLAFAKGIRH